MNALDTRLAYYYRKTIKSAMLEKMDGNTPTALEIVVATTLRVTAAAHSSAQAHVTLHPPPAKRHAAPAPSTPAIASDVKAPEAEDSPEGMVS
jgi:hypothetical protein